MILVEISIFSNFPVLIEQRHLTVVTFSQLSTRCLGLQGTVLWSGIVFLNLICGNAYIIYN